MHLISKKVFLPQIFLALVILFGCNFTGLAADENSNGDWRSLLDEKLSAWEIWLGVPTTPSTETLTMQQAASIAPLKRLTGLLV